MENTKNANAANLDRCAGLFEEDIPARPRQLAKAVRLANLAREQLLKAIDATEHEELCSQLSEACDDLESAIGYMTAVPELEYLGMYVHRDDS